MDPTKVVKLIKEHITRGSYGQELIQETERTVYGRIGSVTQSEWNAAGQRGLEATFKLEVYTFEYDRETIVEIDGERYGIYRTYIHVNDDITELYLNTPAGVTFAEDDIPDEDRESYIKVYETLSSTGITTFYGNASDRPKLPYLIYEMDSANFAADNSVYSNGYSVKIYLYTPRKDLKRERLVEQALNKNGFYWEREETDDIDYRVYVQTYTAQMRGVNE